MTTNVPQIVWGPSGPVVPTDAAILAGVIADYQAAFNNSLNLSIADPATLATPQGQLSTSTTAIISDNNGTFLLQSQMTDPAYAYGRWQDAICRIYFLERDPGEPTILQAACVGAQGVVIGVGALITDTAGNLYSCSTAGTIPASGTITLPFACTVTGPIPVPVSNGVSIYQSIPAWDSVTVVSGVEGVDEENRYEFEIRRQDSVAGNSLGTIGAIIGTVAKVSGVTDYYGYDNGTAAPVTVAGVSIAANSIYICVSGGTDAAVAQAILSKKGGGCAMTGSTTVVAYDNNPLYASPVPYNVSFQRPTSLQLLFAVAIVNGATIPSDAATQIQAAILAAVQSGQGGPRARIASVVRANAYIPCVAALGAWANISSLQVGSANTSGAVINGSISGTTLTVNSVASGAVAIGQQIVADAGNLVPEGTVVLSGSGVTWTISNSLAVGSEVMTLAAANQTLVSVQANQEPVCTAPNITVTVV